VEEVIDVAEQWCEGCDLERVRRAMRGELKFRLIIRDPSGLSFIESERTSVRPLKVAISKLDFLPELKLVNLSFTREKVSFYSLLGVGKLFRNAQTTDFLPALEGRGRFTVPTVRGYIPHLVGSGSEAQPT